MQHNILEDSHLHTCWNFIQIITCSNGSFVFSSIISCISTNVIIGTEILQTQFLDQTSETSSFLLPDSPLEATVVKTEQIQEKRKETATYGPQVRQMLWSMGVQFICYCVNNRRLLTLPQIYFYLYSWSYSLYRGALKCFCADFACCLDFTKCRLQGSVSSPW
jgi:hypothetical protein